MIDALRDDQLLFEAVMQHLPDAVWIRGADGRLITANVAAARLLGLEVSAMRGSLASDLMAEGAFERWHRENEQLLAAGGTQTSEEEINLAIGLRTLLIVKAAFRDSEGRCGVLGIARDITERKRLEQSATQATESLIRHQAQSLRAIIEAQEQERERVGRSLHDNLGASLSSLLVELDACARAPLDEAHARIRAIRQRGESLMSALRDVSRGLHPPELAELGVKAALEQLTVEWGRVHGIALDHDLSGLASVDVGPVCGKAMYRVLQEALANVAKHARATRVSVVVARLHDELRLTVEDDGAGLDPDERPMGQGLRNIGERVRLLDGVLLIEATPGGGTTLHVQIPTERCHG